MYSNFYLLEELISRILLANFNLRKGNSIGFAYKVLMALLSIVKHCRKLVHLFTIHKTTKHTSILVRLCKASLYSAAHPVKHQKTTIQLSNKKLPFLQARV